MADTFSTEKRSEIMRLVKSRKNNSTELKLIVFFKTNNIKGWHRTYPLFGKPDFTFPKEKIVIFVDGCFWHGHNCRNTKPENNKDYWTNKINKNKARDLLVYDYLNNKNWKVIRIWECQLKSSDIIKSLLGDLLI